MLATESNIESNVMIFQGIEKMLFFSILYMFHHPLGGPGSVAKVRRQVSASQGKASAGFKILENRQGCRWWSIYLQQDKRMCTKPVPCNA